MMGEKDAQSGEGQREKEGVRIEPGSEERVGQMDREKT